MFRLDCQIIITGDSRWVFDKVTSIEITEDQQALTQCCRIEIPAKFRWGNESRIPIKRGDRVEVRLGYTNQLATRFRGFVRGVSARNPIVISCEDQMWALKQIYPKKMQHRAIKLSTLLDSWSMGVPVRLAHDMELGNYIVKSDTVAQELDLLRKNWGVRSFFAPDGSGGSVLQVGTLIAANNSPQVVIREGLNLIENKLDQVDTLDIRVKAVSILPSNKRISCEVGEPKGDLRTIYKYNLDMEALGKAAQLELERLQRGGLAGNLITFGHPVVGINERIWVEAANGIKGSYRVHKVVTTFSAAGYRQNISVTQ